MFFQHLPIQLSVFDSHLFCNGCLIYCSGFATTWPSACWSSVSAAFYRDKHTNTSFSCRGNRIHESEWILVLHALQTRKAPTHFFNQSYKKWVTLTNNIVNNNLAFKSCQLNQSPSLDVQHETVRWLSKFLKARLWTWLLILCCTRIFLNHNQIV